MSAPLSNPDEAQALSKQVATPKQLAYLEKLGMGWAITPTLTKTEASDMIDERKMQIEIEGADYPTGYDL